ncbi:MAG: 2-amino-4-hydroxy-6-hydroxymethyldihydropteridine diphosphokinase, partial [Leeuwenhoekiella sp.]
MIYGSIGFFENISPIYKTVSWGFEGPDFLNVVLQVKTILTSKRMLTEILAIEKKLGRSRSLDEKTSIYEDRPIDIDILFYGNDILELKNLQIPHPRLHLRRFVLQPLKDIAQELEHPVFKKSIAELL